MAAKKQTGVAYADMLAYAQSLPGVEESTSYGTPALKVRGKLMTRLLEDNATVVMKTDWNERERLLAVYPEVFFLTDHYLNYPWVLLRLPAASAGLMQSAVLSAWRLVAPKSLQTIDIAKATKTNKRDTS